MSLIEKSNYSLPLPVAPISWNVPIKDYFIPDKSSTITKIVLFSLALGTLYLVARRLYSYCMSKHEIPPSVFYDTPFFRITGKNISPNCPVYLMGTNADCPSSKYPEKMIQTIQKCQLLVSYFPFSHNPTVLRKVVVDTLNLTLNKLKEGDREWFRAQFTRMGYKGVQLEEQMEFITEAQVEMDVILDSWKNKGSISPLIEDIQKYLSNCGLDLLKTHPLIVMDLLGNELDMLEQNYDTIESELVPFFKDQNDRSFIALQGLGIMSAAITADFISSLSHFKEKDCTQKIQMFCYRLINGYTTDEASEEDHLQQPGLFQDHFEQALSRDLNPVVVTLSSTIIAKNLAWQSQIQEAIRLKKSTAIVMPNDNLGLDENPAGMIYLLKFQGYKVEQLSNT